MFAYPHELDGWLDGRATASADEHSGAPATPEAEEETETIAAVEASTGARPWMRALVVAATVLAGAAGFWGWTRPGEPPVALMAVGDELRAIDAAGRIRWNRKLQGLVPDPGSLRAQISDVDADREVDVLATFDVRRPPTKAVAAEFLRLKADGAQQWAVTADDRVTFRDGAYGPPWATEGFASYRVGNEVRIAWALHHFTWWPSLLVTLGPDGRRIGTYVNSGWIRSVVPSADLRYLLLAGVTNSREAYFFAALDPTHPTGHSPEPPGSATECVECPPGGPLMYVVFPRTDVSRHDAFPSTGPSVMTFPDGTIQVHVSEGAGPGLAATIYEFSPDLTLRDARFSDSFATQHRRLEDAGAIAHTLDTCPARAGLEVQRWSAGAGWTSLRVSVR